jgi:hypothetical protein
MTDIVCDMRHAPDTPRQRLDEYARLFAAAFVARERTAEGVRWSLRADPGIAEWARDLAAREQACCAFLAITVTVEGSCVRWDVTSIDDPAARAIVDLFYDLPVAPPPDLADGPLSIVDRAGGPSVTVRRGGG